MHNTDIVIVGAGMAGASVASMLAPHASVVVLEMESQPGYHTTGRSAATWIEGYGNDTIRKLNRGSREFLENPQSEFSEHGFMSPRGMLLLEHEWNSSRLSEIVDEEDSVELISIDEALHKVPPLRSNVLTGAAWSAAAYDIDVDALLGAFLRNFRSHGGIVACNAEVTALRRVSERWQISTKDETYSADVLVNASGAWSADFGRLAGSSCDTGLTPLRRSAAIVPLPVDVDCTRWPITADADESWYFKPEAGQLMVSPADETPVHPHDAYPEDMDIALGIDRFQKAVDVPVERLGHRWAGLRTFARDKTPVVGFDPQVADFFWLSGQGGYGIQTAPAMASLAASLILSNPLPAILEKEELDLAKIQPTRFSTVNN